MTTRGYAKCDDRVPMTRDSAMTLVARARLFDVMLRARHCKSCGSWHVWQRMTAKNRDCERCRQVRHVWRKCPCVCEARCGHPACNGKPTS